MLTREIQLEWFRHLMTDKMARYLLDTSTCIEYFKRRNGVADVIRTLSLDDICVSEITIAELLYGALHSKSVDRHLREVRDLQNTLAVLPISDVLIEYAEIRHELSGNGLVVDDFDMLIGATARHYGLVVVTDNMRHFQRMTNVECENWVARSPLQRQETEN